MRERRLGVVILGRVYHHDPCINHDIPEALQKRGYPIFSQATLPMDDDLMETLFGDEVREGFIAHPLDLSDVWKHTTSASTNLKLWAAKFVARHPNLVAVEVSSFKCGLDAPIYNVVEEIVTSSGTPYFAFKDLDENKAAGSITLRVDTIDYFLTRHRAALVVAVLDTPAHPQPEAGHPGGSTKHRHPRGLGLEKRSESADPDRCD